MNGLLVGCLWVKSHLMRPRWVQFRIRPYLTRRNCQRSWFPRRGTCGRPTNRPHPPAHSPRDIINPYGRRVFPEAAGGPCLTRMETQLHRLNSSSTCFLLSPWYKCIAEPAGSLGSTNWAILSQVSSAIILHFQQPPHVLQAPIRQLLWKCSEQHRRYLPQPLDATVNALKVAQALCYLKISSSSPLPLNIWSINCYYLKTTTGMINNILSPVILTLLLPSLK